MSAFEYVAVGWASLNVLVAVAGILAGYRRAHRAGPEVHLHSAVSWGQSCPARPATPLACMSPTYGNGAIGRIARR
jgi:hypothetical protein